MKLAVYGGSFNPPHLGHREAVISALQALEPDRMLIMPDRIPPHKEMEEGSPEPEERLHLCTLNFGDLEKTEISDLELRRSGKSYTFDTVRELETRYPGAEITLVIGTDMFLTFEEWYRFEYLLSHCRLAVLPRELDDGEQLTRTADRFRWEYRARVELLPHVPIPMHSENIREQLRDRGGVDLLKPEVYAEIIRLRLYGAQPELAWLRERVYERLSEKRIAHVAGCETEAVTLARAWGEDPELAAEAAILHDVTKRLSYREQLQLCEKYDMICDTAMLERPKLLHAVTGAAVAAAEFGAGEPVREAIRWHTTGKPDMTLLERLIYLADYIEPTRDFPGVEKVRKLAYDDLDAAMLQGLRQTVEEIRSEGEEPYRDTLEACAWYQARIQERSDRTSVKP